MRCRQGRGVWVFSQGSNQCSSSIARSTRRCTFPAIDAVIRVQSTQGDGVRMAPGRGLSCRYAGRRWRTEGCRWLLQDVADLDRAHGLRIGGQLTLEDAMVSVSDRSSPATHLTKMAVLMEEIFVLRRASLRSAYQSSQLELWRKQTLEMGRGRRGNDRRRVSPPSDREWLCSAKSSTSKLAACWTGGRILRGSEISRPLLYTPVFRDLLQTARHYTRCHCEPCCWVCTLPLGG